MKRYTLTLIGAAVSIFFYKLSLLLNIDIFEKFAELLTKFEHIEIDEIFFPILIFFFFIFLNIFYINKNKQVKIEKLKIYKAMVSSTHHILNNFLNQVQLLKITAEDTPNFDPKAIELYEETVKEATKQIKALSSIQDINENNIKKSVAP